VDNKPGILKRTWIFMKNPSAKYSVLAIGIVCFFAGIIFWGGFNTAMEATNRLEFCIGCHEMRDTVYQEYKETIHYTNRTGVRAICADCHVPKDWTHKMWRKIKASKEVWGKITGKIDTPEKFEAHRMEMATREWEGMKASDSRECRNCHSFDGMDVQAQKPSAQKKHAEAKQQGKTCIDCHKGIAHLLPEEYEEPAE
jgi:cytochrome c-type protein NapC